MFDIPGFVPERTTVVTVIEYDGDIIVESTTIDSTTFRGVITEVQKKASEEELQELQDFILSTNFFELTQDDARDCIIDIPTVNLTINLGEESNTINSLGAECDPAKTVEAHEIISKIRELVENAQDVSPKIIDEPIIVKTDIPGFVPPEFYESTVTKIFEDGRVNIETTNGVGEDATVSLKLKQLSEDQISDLTNFILNSSFFEITMQDAQTCIADGPSKRLEIDLDGKTNTVSGIGLQCKPSAVDAANSIIQEINLLVEN